MNIDAFILIGGRSSRMGADKAFVKLDGKPLATRAADTIEAALSPQHIRFVAAADTQFGNHIPFPFAHPLVADLKPGFGAWSGLHTSLAYAGTEWAFVLACDLPFVSAEMLCLLAAHLNGGHDAIAPRQPDGRPQPLCAFYRVKPILLAVQALLDAGALLPPLSLFLDSVETLYIGPDEYRHLANSDTFFLNINAPQDLENAVRSVPLTPSVD